MSAWTIWLAIAIIFLIVEMLGPNLISIWFSVAAFIMCPISLLNLPIYLQIIIFIALSVVSMFLLKGVYEKKIKPQHVLKDNLQDKLVSQTGIVTTTIDNSKNEGQIIVGDVYWKATSLNDDIIEKDSKVSIVKIENMRAYVQKI